MAFYQSSSFSDQNGYYYSQSQYQYQVPDQEYYSYSYYPPTQSYGHYEYLPSQPMVAYSPSNGATYTIPASTDHHHYAVYHSEAAPSSPDVKFVEYNPQPYHGGYDIGQTYGEPLPPSDDICYPRSSFAPNPPFLSLPSPSPSPAPAPALALIPAPAPAPAPQQDEDEPEFEEEADDLKSESHVTEEVEQCSDDDDDNDDGDGDGSEDGTSGGSVQVYQGVEEYNGRVVNQNPPGGYGLEAFDICENLFGYWPCLTKLKVSKRCDACGNENAVVAEDVDQWKKTADYLFGNPDPYGEWVDEGGYASGNPVNYAYHHHQVQYQHPAYTLYQQQPDQSSHNSWFY